MKQGLKILQATLLGFLLILGSCSGSQTTTPTEETEYTRHMLSFEGINGLKVGSTVMNEDLDKIGEVKELISDDYWK